MKVHGAGTALDALAVLDANDGDLALALIDRGLPDMDGELLGQRVLAHRHGRNAAMALLAPSGLRGDAERVREAGFAAYLNGTLNGATLLACLNEMLKPDRGGLITVHSLSEASERSLDVLLADDNALNRRLTAILLEQAGHRVAAVADGREAVDAVRGKRFDVVLMDVRMPVLGGLDATAEIRRLPPPACAVPVIAITGNAMQSDAELCRAAGMNDYIIKPIDRATLMDRVTRWGRAAEAGTA
jgi:CheY-like chemotaxis protein